MKLRASIAAAIIAATSLAGMAQDPWLHVYYPKGNDFKQYRMDDVMDISFNEENGTMTVNPTDGTAETLRMTSMDHFVIGKNVCRMEITTDMQTYDETFGYEYAGMPVTEIVSKEIYLDGTLTFDGMGIYDDVSVPVRIRGRGNNTWAHSKKPYRLKFNEKTKFGPIHNAKNQVLLANYLDGSMMKNFAAFKFGEVIGMPFINRSLPVDVYFNGIYKGSYHLTEKVGMNNGSVDIPKADEPNSILFELDTNDSTEDEYPFTESTFNIPVKIKDPDAPVDPNELEQWLDYWQDDLETFLATVDAGDPDAIFDAVDIESLVRYVMVFNIACNQEVNHPKSVYLHKTKGGKYEFGPCWDFDWAYGYQPTYKKGQGTGQWWGPTETYPSYENPLIGFGNFANQGGNYLFYALCNNSVFKAKFEEVWNDFYSNKRNAFWQAFEEYADTLEPSANLQGLTRNQYRDWRTTVDELRTWIENRIEFINSDPNHGLWE